MSKIITKTLIKNIANKLELEVAFGKAISLIEIHRELEHRGYRAFDNKTNKIIKKVLLSMGWKFNKNIRG